MLIQIVFLVFGASPALIAALPSTPGWHELSNTKIDDVCPCSTGYEPLCGAEGCSGITADWSGGFFETTRNRLIVWGGGHNGYYGNELYALTLSDSRMSRITQPAAPIGNCNPAGGDCVCGWAGCGCMEALAGGTQPNSRHTYDGNIYMPNVDKMFTVGGSLACPIGYASQVTWMYNFANQKWERASTDSIHPAGNYGIMCDYDPNTGKVLVHDLLYLMSFDPSTQKYTRLSGRHWGVDYHLTGVLDPKRKKFVMIGNGQQWVIDVAAGSNFALQNLGSSGGSAVVGDAYPGLAYDARQDRIVAWSGGDAVYSLNMDTKQWSSVTYSGGPGAAIVAGTYKRWSYSPAADAFVLVNRTNQNAYAFRFAGSTAAEIRVAAAPTGLINGVLYDLCGRRVGRLAAGKWNASSAPNGVYIVRARAGNRIVTKRLLVQK